MVKLSTYLDLPPITLDGIGFDKCPYHIFKPILEYYNYRKTTVNKDPNIYPLGDHVKFFYWVAKEIKPIFDNWCKVPIEFSYMYGIHSYKNKEIIELHREHLQTHHISAQILIDKDKDWNFDLYDHGNNLNTIPTLNIGDIILYEGAKLLHGRPLPFEGTYYDILYVHYKLKN